MGIKVEESAINLNYKKKIVALECLENSELQKNKLENYNKDLKIQSTFILSIFYLDTVVTESP